MKRVLEKWYKRSVDAGRSHRGIMMDAGQDNKNRVSKWGDMRKMSNAGFLGHDMVNLDQRRNGLAYNWVRTMHPIGTRGTRSHRRGHPGGPIARKNFPPAPPAPQAPPAPRPERINTFRRRHRFRKVNVYRPSPFSKGMVNRYTAV
jgi:hypothetical protein